LGKELVVRYRVVIRLVRKVLVEGFVNRLARMLVKLMKQSRDYSARV